MKKTNGLSKAQKQGKEKNYQTHEEVSNLFARFIKEKRFLCNLSERTLRSYERDVFRRWMKYVGKMPSPDNLGTFIVGMREDGIGVTTCNISIRSMNSFLTWLHTQGYPLMHLKQLKEDRKIMKTPDDKVLSTLVNARPKDWIELRTQTMIAMMIDCGFRVTEVITVKTEDVDFDNLLIKVTGKGSKDRLVPMSIELRKTLYRYFRQRKSRFQNPYFFCTTTGTEMNYHNLYRDLKALIKRLKIEKDFDGLFHMFRRKYARNYLKHGGNLIYLQTTMGHSSIQMTQKYVEPETEDLHNAHLKTSLLARLK